MRKATNEISQGILLSEIFGNKNKKSQVRSNVEMTPFHLIGYRDWNNESCKPKTILNRFSMNEEGNQHVITHRFYSNNR